MGGHGFDFVLLWGDGIVSCVAWWPEVCKSSSARATFRWAATCVLQHAGKCLHCCIPWHGGWQHGMTAAKGTHERKHDHSAQAPAGCVHRGFDCILLPCLPARLHEHTCMMPAPMLRALHRASDRFAHVFFPFFSAAGCVDEAHLLTQAGTQPHP